MAQQSNEICLIYASDWLNKTFQLPRFGSQHQYVLTLGIGALGVSPLCSSRPYEGHTPYCAYCSMHTFATFNKG
jgi:hypothetical protein